MGRPKKVEIEGVENVEEVVNEQPVEVKKPVIELSVRYPALDEEGNKTTQTLTNSGAEIEKVVKGINLPKGLNANIKVSVSKNGLELLRSITGSKAQRIFVEGDVALLQNIFRGIL